MCKFANRKMYESSKVKREKIPRKVQVTEIKSYEKFISEVKTNTTIFKPKFRHKNIIFAQTLCLSRHKICTTFRSVTAKITY